MKTNYPTKKSGVVCEINRGQSPVSSTYIFYPLSLRGGYAALTAILLIIFSSLTIVGGLAFFAVQEAGVNRAYGRSVAARSVAEAGVEDGTYRILAGKQIGSSETLAVGSDSTTISVATVGNQRTVRSAGTRANVQQNIQVLLDVSATNVGLHFGAQVGDGGLIMGQNSSVSGSVFSNGAITGSNGAVITGDAFAAGASKITGVSVSGSAQAHQIEDSTVGGYASSTAKIEDVIVGKDAHANELHESTINKNAYFNIIDKQSVVLGSRITPTAPPVDLAPLPMPIAPAAITQWKSDAAAGGTVGGQNISGIVSLGPKKINGDLNVSSGATLIVTGTLWVVGQFQASNNATIKLSSGYGMNSGVIVGDNPISISNNVAMSGSGQAGSYIMLVAAKNAPASQVMDISNNTTGAIFYAANGRVHINNNAGAREITAYGIDLDNNATISYEVGLANMQFSSGPKGGYDIKYWKQVE